MKSLFSLLVCLAFVSTAIAADNIEIGYPPSGAKILNPSTDPWPVTIVKTTDGSSNVVPIMGASGGSIGIEGRTSVGLVRNVYSTTPVTTAAYVELVASNADVVNELFIFDSSGQTIVLATGAAASEVDKLYIVPGGNGLVPLAIPAGTRVSIKAVSANATVGEISISFLK